MDDPDPIDVRGQICSSSVGPAARRENLERRGSMLRIVHGSCGPSLGLALGVSPGAATTQSPTTGLPSESPEAGIRALCGPSAVWMVQSVRSWVETPDVLPRPRPRSAGLPSLRSNPSRSASFGGAPQRHEKRIVTRRQTWVWVVEANPVELSGLDGPRGDLNPRLRGIHVAKDQELVVAGDVRERFLYQLSHSPASPRPSSPHFSKAFIFPAKS